MGGRIVVPEPDAKMSKAMRTFMLTPKEVSKFWKVFQKLDKVKSGLIPIEAMCQMIEVTHNAIIDALFELLEIQHDDGEINFSDFLVFVCTLCMFDDINVLKFCFYMFDQDKTGFFTADDLKALMNTVNEVTGIGEDGVKGNARASWKKVLVPGDDQIDFRELQKINQMFPHMFKPVFRLQQQMMIGIMGERWWASKKFRIKRFQDVADRKIKKKEENAELRAKRIKDKKIRKRMGLLMYYFCCCLRYRYDPSYEEALSAEERALREQKIKDARRQAELRLKNPETVEWKQFEKKIDPAQGGSESYVIEKHLKTERPRGERKESRAERQKARRKEGDLHLKQTVSTSGTTL